MLRHWLFNRRLVRLVGKDALPLLQGLLTNDVQRLNRSTPLYSFLLNIRGRVMYDLMVYAESPGEDVDHVLLECDTAVSDELLSLLRKYRLRKRVDIDPEDSRFVYWLRDPLDPADHCLLASDPRLSTLGYRLITTEQPADGTDQHSASEELYTDLRYSQGIAEGIRDIAPGVMFPHELNGDLLGAISFTKGCFVGQELTARTQHLGVIRKRLMPLEFDECNAESVRTVQRNAVLRAATGAKVGTFKGASKGHALALLNVSNALRARRLVAGESTAEFRVLVPEWWPKEVTEQ